MANIIHVEIKQEAINSRKQREHKHGAAYIRNTKNQQQQAKNETGV